MEVAPKTSPLIADALMVRWRQLRTHRFGLVVAAALGIMAVLPQLLWLVRYRAGHPFDIDEAGYISIALDQAAALRRGQLIDLGRVFLHHGPAAPLAPLLAAPILAVFGPDPSLAMAVPVLTLLGTLVATFAIARTLQRAPVAVLSTLMVAGLPVMIDYSRTFQFALPATACFTAALAMLARSRSLLSPRAMLLWGVCVGLMLLSRTMTVAFLPGLLVAAGLAWLASSDRVQAARNLGLGVMAMTAVAAPWYLGNWREVSGYLLGAGYGATSTQYQFATAPPLSLDGMTAFLYRQVNEYLYLPAALVLGAGLAAGLWRLAAWWDRCWETPIRTRMAHLARRPEVVIAVAVASGMAALMSSRNAGTGFIAPLLPAATVLAVCSLARLPHRGLRVVALSLAALVGLWGVLAKSGIPPLDRGRLVVAVPMVGDTTVYLPAGPIQLYERDGGYGGYELERPRDDADWRPDERQAAELITSYARARGTSAICGFGFQDRFFNGNTLNLEARVGGREPIPCVGLDSLRDGSDGPAVERWLGAGGGASVNVLMTATGTSGEDASSVDPEVMTRGALAAGFYRIGQMTLPNRREVTFWWRSARSRTKLG